MTKKSLKDSPVEWAEMITGYLEVLAGTAFSPLFQGLPDDKCQCPHWGYVFKGALHIGYTDGTEEVLKAGQVYYMPPGHTVWTTDEDTALLVIGPAEEEKVIIQHVQKKGLEISLQSA